VGQGKPGDIVRNLLLEVYQQPDKTNWESLSREIEEIFGYRLLAPQYEGRPYILAEYLPGVPRKKGRDGLPALDISSAGSGFLQVLLLLGFFYARPASVLLLDEPDAHLHVILQKQVYDRLRRVAADRKCQLIVATHSEVLVDGTSPEMILSFYRKPHRLLSDVEREQVREPLRRLTATEILLAEQSPGVLYVEGETDFNLLRAWARVLGHRTYDKFFKDAPFWHSNQGRHPREARAHFFALRAVKPGMKGVLLLDGDNRNLPDHEVLTEGLSVARWARYEAESYLIHPSALQRFAAKVSPGDLFASKGLQFLRDELPGAVLRDPLGDHDYLNRTPASKTLLPGFLKAAQATVPRKDYYLIAEQMNQDEIAAEVQQKLDAIADAFGL